MVFYNSETNFKTVFKIDICIKTESALVELLTTRTPDQINAAKSKYHTSKDS